MHLAGVLLNLVGQVLIVLFGISFLNFPLFAWHENTGLTDEKATELSVINPQNPDIVNWKSGIEDMINHADYDCFGYSASNPSGNTDGLDTLSCREQIKNIYLNCIHHLGLDFACDDERFLNYLHVHGLSADLNQSYVMIDVQSISQQKEAQKTYSEFLQCVNDVAKGLRQDCQ